MIIIYVQCTVWLPWIFYKRWYMTYDTYECNIFCIAEKAMLYADWRWWYSILESFSHGPSLSTTTVPLPKDFAQALKKTLKGVTLLCRQIA